MDIVIVSVAALLAAGLTLFSGFGLGTLLMPVVALFFPLELAIAITALVHLANNVFKVALIGRHADIRVLVHFGIPAIAAAFLGAALLAWLGGRELVFGYQLGAWVAEVSLLKLVIGVLILGFVWLELRADSASTGLDPRWLPLGGLVSGFFGGLSGHQGALRSLFLIKAGLDKRQFVATAALLAVMVDLSRLLVYGGELLAQRAATDWLLVGAATLSAFAGTWLGARLIDKVTLKLVQKLVAVMLVLIGLGLILGIF